jgi:ABC-type sugar transport system substrate-binding protein
MKGPAMKRTLPLALAVLVAAVLVAACGSSGPSSAGASAGTSTAAGSAGKPRPPHLTIGYIDIAATVGVEPQIYQAFAQGAADLGWTVKFADAQNNPTKALQAAESFVSQGVSAIVFSSVPGPFVYSAVQTAKQHDIPTINIVTYVQNGIYSAQYTYQDTQHSLAPMIDKMKADLPHGSSVGLVISSQIFADSSRPATLRNAITSAGFKVVGTVDPQIADILQNTQTGVTNLVRANPGLAAIVDLDGNVQQDALGLKEANDTTTKIYSFNVTSETVPTMLEANSPLTAVLYPLYGDDSAIALDQLLRHFGTGHAPLAAAITNSQSSLYTLANLPQSIRDNPDGNQAPLSPAQILAPYVASWSKDYTLSG